MLTHVRRRSLRAALCLVNFLMAVAFLPTAALAAPSITLSKKIGPPTSKILVSGDGFAANAAVDVYFDTHDERLIVTDNEGNFHDAAIRAQRSAKPGNHWVTAVERIDGQAAQRLFVVETDWRAGRYDAANSGFNSYENVLNPRSVTSLELVGIEALADDSVPTVADGVIYFANSLGYVYALSARTGRKLWQYRDIGGSVFSPPAVVDGIVYFGGYEDVHALDAKTGKVIWDNRETDGQGIFALTVVDGRVYFTTGGANAYALDAKNGSQVWSYFVGGADLLSAPAIANGVVYIASTDLVALNARTGKFLWSCPIGNPENTNVMSSPSVSNGVVYVGSENGAIYAVDIGSASLLWSYTTGGSIYNNLAVGEGVVYVPSGDADLYAFDAYSGAVLWKYPFLSSSPALANGVLYVGVYLGQNQSNLSALDAHSGNVLWQYETYPSAEAPSVANGRVYVGDFYSNIYAFGLRRGESDEASSTPPDPKTLLPELHLGSFDSGK